METPSQPGKEKRAQDREKGGRTEKQPNVRGKGVGDPSPGHTKETSTHARTHARPPHRPGQPSLPGGGGSMREVRSPQLSKASVAQLPGISTKSWAALRRITRRQLHSCLAAPCPLCPLPLPAPAHTLALTPFLREAGTLPLPGQAGEGIQRGRGKRGQGHPPVSSPAHTNRQGAPRDKAE